MNGLGLVALRLSLAAVFIAHGTHKLFGLFAGPGIGVGGPEITSQFFTAMQLEPAFALAVATGVAETLGGLFLIAGWFTRVVAPVLAVVMAIAIWKVHLPWGFFLNWVGAPDRGHGMELNVVIIGGLVCLALTGAGDWSIDGSRAKSAAQREAGRARLRGRV